VPEKVAEIPFETTKAAHEVTQEEPLLNAADQFWATAFSEDNNSESSENDNGSPRSEFSESSEESSEYDSESSEESSGYDYDKIDYYDADDDNNNNALPSNVQDESERLLPGERRWLSSRRLDSNDEKSLEDFFGRGQEVEGVTGLRANEFGHSF
jgi:hypothetical protein